MLEPAALFEDEVIELAPLASYEDWARWFEVQLLGHFSEADIAPR